MIAFTLRLALAVHVALVFPAGATAADDPLAPPDYVKAFVLAFTPGFSWPGDDPKVKVPFKVIDGGLLKISSGEIVACDPFVFPEFPPFLQEVPIGQYPVQFAYPMVHGEAGGRVAFARVNFSAKPVVKWQMAVTAQADLATLKPGYIFGYPVDAGTGSFSDKAAGEAVTRMVNEGKLEKEYSQAWIDDGEIAGKARGMNFYLDVAAGSANIIMFGSGWGDGFYASYFGYDAQGEVAALITDFQVMDWSLGELR